MSFKSYVAPLVETRIPLAAMDLGGSAPAVTIIQGVPFLRAISLDPPNPYPAPAISATSSDASVVVASVDSGNSLKILGLSPGSAVVTVSAGGGITGTLSVTVQPPPPIYIIQYPAVPDIAVTSLTLLNDTKTLTVMQQFDLGVIPEPWGFNKGSIAWSSSDSRVAIVADVSRVEHRTGVNRLGHVATIRAIAPGTATITASVGAIAESCVVTVV